ncbi:hypothetical protein [Enterococcus rivorum]|uniref:Uncharacterized protein n=1 Tax=Enterococcus rivorum TaxID=762845 RepID=A0A1E5KWW7_9ENTE|nr:hypothetical protein [Enterococcus rivorum]MBP2097291.1 ABC-2 type transport system permease protein [Enterococcus rivorum]OEH82357.1 hypothetical protein BCR26_02700 [Enterococcus rivorum]
MKEAIDFIQVESRRHFFSEGINYFYFMSIIIWPIISFIQLLFNFQIFPLEKLSFLGIHNPKDLFYYMFIGYVAFIIFQTVVQSAWRIGFERFQGTLSTIFMAPISKVLWLYSRSIAIVLTNGWFYLCAFIGVNSWYHSFSLYTLSITIFASFLLFIGATIWGSFLMTFFILLRDGTILFILLEGPQEAFSGAKVPVQVTPFAIQLISSCFPLTYTILLLRSLLLMKGEIVFYGGLFILLNLILIALTIISLHYGEKQLRRKGSFDLY